MQGLLAVLASVCCVLSMLFILDAVPLTSTKAKIKWCAAYILIILTFVFAYSLENVVLKSYVSVESVDGKFQSLKVETTPEGTKTIPGEFDYVVRVRGEDFSVSQTAWDNVSLGDRVYFIRCGEGDFLNLNGEMFPMLPSLRLVFQLHTY